jgi:hypothetical protein
MSLSANRTSVRSVDELVADGYQLAGLWNQAWSTGTPIYQEKLIYGRRILTDILDELQTAGITTKFGYFYDQTLTVDQEYDTLPTYVLEVVGDGKYIAANESDVTRASSESIVRQVTRGDYQAWSARDKEGDPTQFYADRTGTAVVVRYNRIPDEAGTIRFVVKRSATRADSGDVEIELQRHWHSYVRFRLAYELASSAGLPGEICNRLQRESQRLEQRARIASNESVSDYIRLEHPTPGN